MAVSEVNPDTALVTAARKGDAAALDQLFQRHFNFVYGLAFRLSGKRPEVEEIVQDVFVETLGSLGKLRDDGAFRAWLGQIVVFVSRRHLRKKRLLRTLGLAEPEPIDRAGLVSPDAPPDVQADSEKLYRILDSLPERPRIALIMRHIEGRQIDEIAVLLAGSRASVKRWLGKAEEHVRKRMRDPAQPVAGGKKAEASR